MLQFKQLLKRSRSPLKSYVRHHSYPIQFQNFLNNMNSVECTKLENGLTVASEERETYNACIGIYMDGGTRYESDFENGLAHFFEHIAFKGTKARNKCALEEQMTCTGARYKCFTTREMIGYYAECMTQDLPVVFDLLTDCVFNNAYVEADIEQQKKVVCAEMEEHDRDSNALLDDYLHSTAFQGTPLEKPVMGKSRNLTNFDGPTMSRYWQKFCNSNRTVVVGVGGIKHEQLLYLACTYMSQLEPTKCIDTDIYRYTGSEVRYRDDSQPAANVAIAVEGPALCDEDCVVMDVAAQVVGGWDRSQPGGMDHSSYVARAVSTDHICDSFKAFNINYKDTGLWGVQFTGNTMRLDDMVYVVQNEWMNLSNTVTEGEVERGKRALKTAILSRSESATRTCQDIARGVLYRGGAPSLPALVGAVERVTPEQVRRVCHRYLYDKCPAVAAIGPTEGLPDYSRIRGGMYWLRL